MCYVLDALFTPVYEAEDYGLVMVIRDCLLDICRIDP